MQRCWSGAVIVPPPRPPPAKHGNGRGGGEGACEPARTPHAGGDGAACAHNGKGERARLQEGVRNLLEPVGRADEHDGGAATDHQAHRPRLVQQAVGVGRVLRARRAVLSRARERRERRRSQAARLDARRALRYSCASSSTRLSSASYPLSTPTTCTGSQTTGERAASGETGAAVAQRGGSPRDPP